MTENPRLRLTLADFIAGYLAHFGQATVGGLLDASAEIADACKPDIDALAATLVEPKPWAGDNDGGCSDDRRSDRGRAEAKEDGMRIPIAAAKRFADETGCAQIIVAAWDGEQTHVVTYGRTTVDCDQAAMGGDKLKAALGFPYDPTCLPSRVRRLQAENARLRRALDAAKAAD